MVSTERLERHLPTFYKWGRAIKGLVIGKQSNIDVERMGVGRFRESRVPNNNQDYRHCARYQRWMAGAAMVTGPNTDSALAPQHLIDPYFIGRSYKYDPNQLAYTFSNNKGPNTDSARPLRARGGLDNYLHIGRMSVFNNPAIKSPGVAALAGQHLIDPYPGARMVSGPNADTGEHSRSDLSLSLQADYLRLYSTLCREQAGRMKKFVEREEPKLAPGVKEQLLSKAAESNRIALQLQELSSRVYFGAKDRRAERWQTGKELYFRDPGMVSGPNTDSYLAKQGKADNSLWKNDLMHRFVPFFDADKIDLGVRYDQSMFGLHIIDEKGKPSLVSDADQIDVPKKFKPEEAKEWKNVGSEYLSIKVLFAKLIDWIRKPLK